MAYESLFAGGDDDIQSQREIARLLSLLETEEGAPRRPKQLVMDRYPPGTPGPERTPSFRHLESGGSSTPDFGGVTSEIFQRDRKPVSARGGFAGVGDTFSSGPRMTGEVEPNFSNVQGITAPWYQRAWDATKRIGGQAYDVLASGESPLEQYLNADEKFRNASVVEPPPPAPAATPPATPLSGARAAAGRRGAGGAGAAGGPLSGAVAAQAAGGGSPTADPWEAYKAELQRRRGAFDAQLEALNKPPDYTDLQRQMRQRGGAGSDLMAAAAISGLGPAEMRGMQEHILKRAEGMQAPQKVEGGVITAEGELQIDPMYQQLKKKELLEKRIEQLNKMEQSAISSQEKAEIARERIRSEERMDRLMAETRLMVASMRGGGKGKGGGDGDGDEMDQLPKGATNEEKKNYAANRELIAIGPQLIADVQANPGAFSWRIGAAETVGGLPGLKIGQSQVKGLGVPLSEKEAVTRGRVYNIYSKIMSERIGAAQTEGEISRLRSFIPPPGADAATVVRLMQAGLADARASRAAARQAYPSMGPDRLLGDPDARYFNR